MLLSTSMRNALVGSHTGFMEFIDFYTGALPSTGDTSPTGTLLVRAQLWANPGGGIPARGEYLFFSTGIGAYTARAVDITGAIIAGNIFTKNATATGTIGYAALHFGSNPSPEECVYVSVGTTVAADMVVNTLTVVAGNPIEIITLHVSVPGVA